MRTCIKGNQHVLFPPWGWLHDCLQTTAESKYISQWNLITQRTSHGLSSRRHVMCGATAYILGVKRLHTFCLDHRSFCITFMSVMPYCSLWPPPPLVSDLFKANFSIRHDLTLLGLYDLSPHFSVTDTTMWDIKYTRYYTRPLLLETVPTLFQSQRYKNWNRCF